MASTNFAPVPGVNSVAPAPRALEADLAAATNNTLAFLDLRDGDTLPTRQAAVRVKGPRGGKLLLAVNGEEVSGSRLGRRAALADKQAEAWEFVGVEFRAGTNRLEAVFTDSFGNERGRLAISVIAPDKLARLLPPGNSMKPT